MRPIVRIWLLAAAVPALAGCDPIGAEGARVAAIGDPAHGRELIRDFGCGACHLIPGVRGAQGMVGPPLIKWSRRAYIAGALPNTPDNLINWIMAPQAIEPGTAMPMLGVTPDQARHIAAYLYTLR